MSGLLIRGARLLDPDAGVDGVADLRIAEGRIAAIGDRLPAQGATLLDGAGLWLLPGLIEPRARLHGAPGDAGQLETELRSAVAGGITTLAVMPVGSAVAELELTAHLRQRAQLAGLARVVPVAPLTVPGGTGQLAELGLLRQAGCVAAAQAGQVLSGSVLRRALEYARGHDLPVLLDSEDAELAAGGCVHEGALAARLGLTGIPVTAELRALTQAIQLAELTGARVHCGALSSAAGVELIAQARARGVPVTGDVGLWHLLYTDEALAGFDAAFHLRPPLRSDADRRALRAALANGTLGGVSADHVPLSADAKAEPFARTAPGAAGFEVLLPLLLSLAEAALPLSRLVHGVTRGPAQLLGLPVGTLDIGAPADLCLYDPHAPWTVGPDTWHSAGRCTPAWGMTLRGRVRCTLVGGRMVYAQEAFGDG